MDTLFRGIETGESSVSGEERQRRPRPPPGYSTGPHVAAPPAHRGGALPPRRRALDPAMATDSTLFLWMGLGFGWQREGRGKMEARVAVDPPATGSGSTRIERRRRHGCESCPRHMRRWRHARLSPSRSPSLLGGPIRALRCRWVSRANPRSSLQLGGFAARAMRVCGVVDPVGSCRGPRHLHPDTQAMGLQ